MHNENILIGTLVSAGNAASHIPQLLPHGFESFEISFWETMGNIDIDQLAGEVGEALAGSSAVVSCLGIYGNPLGSRPKDELTREGWRKLIQAAPCFGCDLVTGFAGRMVDCSLPESIERFAEVFGPLSAYASDRGVRLAFENCDMGGDWELGDWNIAHGPAAWEMMFDAVPADNLGLEWEPCHQMCRLIEPLPQLRKWVGKVFHVHGKDATIYWDVIREYGVGGGRQFAYHRTPGFGDSNWTDIVSELRRGGFKGSIDIEGWHDPVYKEDLEMTGQVHGLNYLKQCRGGAYVPNPS